MRSVFDHNSFEQLCINYANEKLQQLFNLHTFKQEEQLYIAEGVDHEHVEFIDNQPVLTLIEGRPAGVLACLDDEAFIGPKGVPSACSSHMVGVAILVLSRPQHATSLSLSICCSVIVLPDGRRGSARQASGLMAFPQVVQEDVRVPRRVLGVRRL